jgi:cupin superfamily acireductone dioxygenase involved in methionine salvage
MLPRTHCYFDVALQRWAWNWVTGNNAYISVPMQTKHDFGLPESSFLYGSILQVN